LAATTEELIMFAVIEEANLDADKIKIWILSAWWFFAGLSLGGFVSKLVYS
jgi:hypothetical protein